jgi:S1-C subfamily serine protease
LFNYYAEDGLHSISIKLKQQNFVSGLPDGEEVEIIAKDKKNDIALLRKRVSTPAQPLTVLNYPIGKAKDLEWGTVVYTMGYPIGNLMVTRAIVSKPSKNGNGMFLTDALFNHGISGSPVLALRDGVPNFEWVGMASSSSAQSIHYLKPSEDTPLFIAPDSPYSGETFVVRKKSINYGVTFSVRIEDIVKFLSNNKKLLQQEGFTTDLFFK